MKGRDAFWGMTIQNYDHSLVEGVAGKETVSLPSWNFSKEKPVVGVGLVAKVTVLRQRSTHGARSGYKKQGADPELSTIDVVEDV